MVSSILSVAFFAGLAAAACPLAVDIASATDHVTEVTVTNTGSETLTVFKGNTVFSEHATKDLLVADAGISYFLSPIFDMIASGIANSICRW
jgi:deuterolysin